MYIFKREYLPGDDWVECSIIYSKVIIGVRYTVAVETGKTDCSIPKSKNCSKKKKNPKIALKNYRSFVIIIIRSVFTRDDRLKFTNWPENRLSSHTYTHTVAFQSYLYFLLKD